MMKQEIPIFPEVKVDYVPDKTGVITVMISSRTRVSDDEGNHYFVPVSFGMTLSEEQLQTAGVMSEVISRFNYNAYMTIMCGNPNLKFTDHRTGKPIFELDPDPITEPKRMNLFRARVDRQPIFDRIKPKF